MFKNMKKITLWLFLTMIISFFIAGSILATEGIDKTILNHSGKRNTQDIDMVKSFDLSGIKTIDINTMSTDINIIPVDSKEVKVHLYGTAASNNESSVPKLFSGIEGNKLNIQIKQSFKVTIGFNFQNNNLKLDIYVPDIYSENITVHSTSANLYISEFTLDDLNIESTSGDLAISSVNARQAIIATTSGNTDFDSFSGNLDFKSSSGSIYVKYKSFNNNININTTSGNARIELPGDSQFDLTFKSSSGNLINDFPLVTHDTKNRNKITGSTGSSSNTINIETTSGDANIINK